MRNFSLWNFGKTLALWLIIAVLLVALLNLFVNFSTRPAQPPMAYSDFIEAADQGQVREVHIDGRLLAGHLSDGRSFFTYDPGDPNLIQRLLDKKVTSAAADLGENAPSILSIFLSWLPLLLLAGMFISVLRKMPARGGTPLDIQIRLEQLEAQMRTFTAQLGEIKGALSRPPGRADQAEADRALHF